MSYVDVKESVSVNVKSGGVVVGQRRSLDC